MMTSPLLERICAIGNELQAHRFALTSEHERCARQNRLICVPLQVLNALTGSGSAFSTSMNYATMSWQELGLNALVMLATTLNGVNAALGYKQRMVDLQTSASKINEMCNKVQNFVLTGGADYTNCVTFLETLTLEYEFAKENMPAVSSWSKAQLEKELAEAGSATRPDAIRIIVPPNQRTTKGKQVFITTPHKPPPLVIGAGSSEDENSDKDAFNRVQADGTV